MNRCPVLHLLNGRDDLLGGRANVLTRPRVLDDLTPGEHRLSFNHVLSSLQIRSDSEPPDVPPSC